MAPTSRFARRSGSENFFLFGLTTEEVAELEEQGYQPMECYHTQPELREVIDLIRNGYFSAATPICSAR